MAAGSRGSRFAFGYSRRRGPLGRCRRERVHYLGRKGSHEIKADSDSVLRRRLYDNSHENCLIKNEIYVSSSLHCKTESDVKISFNFSVNIIIIITVTCDH